MTRPYLGFGLGLRTEHFHHILAQLPDVDWFEVLTENFMVAGGKPRYYLDAIRERYPIVMHGVSLSIGSSEPLNADYLRALRTLVQGAQPQWISDHLCWTFANGINSHDLLPLPYTEEALRHVVERVRQVQDFLGQQILLENVSSYLDYQASEMTEWDFLSAVAAAADCKILLDINNIYVSSRNHGFDPLQYLMAIDPARVQQFHLAGHSDYGDYVIDTHDHDIVTPVWQLYRTAVQRFGAVSTMIERDANIPPFDELYAELQVAKKHALAVLPEMERRKRSLTSTASIC